MKETLGRLFRLLLLAALAPPIYSFTLEAFPVLLSDLDPRPVGWFSLGLLCYFVLYGFIVSLRGRSHSNLEFLRVLRHEFTHAIIALLVGRRAVEMLVVNPAEKPGEGSHVIHSGPPAPVFLISLAPYCLPMFTVPFLLLKLLPFTQLDRPIDFLIGFTLAFHYSALAKEFTFQQDDIKRTGALFSLVLTIFSNLVFLVITKIALHQDWAAIIEYFSDSVARGQESYKFVIEEIRRQGLFSRG